MVPSPSESTEIAYFYSMYGPGRDREAVDANERSEDNFCSMKITQEVREFAAKQNSDSFVATEAPEGAEEGMEEMRRRFRKEGGEIYLKAD